MHLALQILRDIHGANTTVFTILSTINAQYMLGKLLKHAPVGTEGELFSQCFNNKFTIMIKSCFNFSNTLPQPNESCCNIRTNHIERGCFYKFLWR